MGPTCLNDRVGPKVKVISNAIRRTVDKSTAELGITGAQSFLLGYLERNGEKRPCQHDIEVEFNIKHPTATGILQRLAEKGYVTFEPDRDDRRLKRIVLTAEGLAAALDTKAKLDETETALVRGFTEAERTELHRLLDKLVENARDRVFENPTEGDETTCSKDL